MTTQETIDETLTVDEAKKRSTLQLGLIYGVTLVVYLLTIVASFSQRYEITF